MKKTFIIHPLLFTLFPIFSLLSHNKDLINFGSVLWPAFISLGAAIFLFEICNLIVRSKEKTALIVSLFVFLFFSFGHFLSFFTPVLHLGDWEIKNFGYYVLFILEAVVFLSVSSLIATRRRPLTNINNFLNIVSLALLIVPVCSLGFFYIKTPARDSVIDNFISEQAGKLEVSREKNSENFPDIYYLVFDGHARADVLKELYHADNSGFLKDLEEKGFFVADKSRANYPQTYLSIGSTLNFSYLDSMIQDVPEEELDRSFLRKLIRENEVMDILREKGYKIVAMPYTWTGTYKNIDADIYLNETRFTFNEFDEVLINTTPLSLVFNKSIRVNSLRKKLNFAFEQVPRIAAIPGPTFTYVHFLTPHPPFIFGASGEELYPGGSASGLDGDHYFKENPGLEKYREKYVAQLEYIDQRIIALVDGIIADSREKPIIIIQSDHGPGSGTFWEEPEKTDMHERLSILNAYLVPDEIKKNLYPSITPVNSFRLVFNGLFGTDFETLTDRSYFSTWTHPFGFIEVGEGGF